MADFDLTQTDQQVQNILNDAQGAMGASAQTTLTTEYVMLKDTSGIYHKILKSSFTEAIRDVLAGLLVNNDKGTTINQIAAIASGDFGSITPANLASVLGDLITKMAFKSVSSTSIDNFVPDGNGVIVTFYSNHINGLPSSYSNVTRFFCISILYADYYGVQIVFDVTSGSKQAPYYRLRSGNSWSGVDWSEF